MNLMPDSLNKKLSFAGVASILAYIVGVYFAFLPMTLLGFPDFITAGNVEWAMTILAVGYGVLCIFMLYLSPQHGGVSWPAYAIGLLAASATTLVIGVVLFGLLSSRQ